MPTNWTPLSEIERFVLKYVKKFLNDKITNCKGEILQHPILLSRSFLKSKLGVFSKCFSLNFVI